MWWYTHRENDEPAESDEFIDPKLREKLDKTKDFLSSIPCKTLRSARMRYDGYFIGGILRGVIKIANLNYHFNFIKDLKTFGDIGGGPGGFVDYILFKNPTAVGYGITLHNDYKIHSNRFHIIRGSVGDGDIMKPVSFPKNLDFVIGDVGCDVVNAENLQENIHVELFVSQARLAVGSVKVGGLIILKFFDMDTLRTVKLLMWLAKSFEKICICKPESSRPANSERYFVGINKLDEVDDEVVLTKSFYEYILNTNCEMGESQLSGLGRLIEFTTNREHTKTEFIEKWDLESYIRYRRKRKREQCIIKRRPCHYKVYRRKYLNA